MRTRRLLVSVLCLLAALAAGCARGIQVQVGLVVEEPAQVDRQAGVVTTGVPFARGAVRDVSDLSVRVGGEVVPAQFIETVPWADGSVRWALMDCQIDVPAGGKAALVVRSDGRNKQPASPVKVHETAASVTVSSGPLQLTVSREKFNLFESLTVDGRELLTAAGRGLVLYTKDGKQVPASPATEVKIEQAGPLRAIVAIKGKFPGVHNDLLGYTVRITAYAGKEFVKVHAWLENDGAIGYGAGGERASSANVEWFLFDGMAVELGLGLGERVAAKCEGAEAVGSLKVLQTCRESRAQAKEPRKKPPFYTWDDFEYTITQQGKALRKGTRTDGVVEVSGDDGTVTAAIRDFWQNYEKAIELDGQRLILWLWPTEGQWPRAHSNFRYGGLVDKNLEVLHKDGLYYLPGAVHKGHEFILDFSGRDPEVTAAELSVPLMALASAEYYASTEAAPGLFAPPGTRTGDEECDAKLDAWMRMTHSAADPQSPTGLFKARRTSSPSVVGYFSDSCYWFGWMDFGDLTVPSRGPVSLHYDWPWIMMVNAMRTGNPDFMRLATDMTRHRMDIDQHWSDRDSPEYRGLQRGDSNYPAFHTYRLYRPPGVTTNWLSGVVLYYMLTGEPKAYECCMRNARGLESAWASRKNRSRRRASIDANARSMLSLCSLYDLTADRKYLDDAMALFTTNITARWRRLGPHLHDAARQIQSQDYLKEDIQYCYGLQALCELHHRTGDENLMKLLKEGCELEFPESFYDAPFYLANLYAYVGHKTRNADYIEKSIESFIEGFTESRSPPVFMPDNSQWTRQSAMMLRTGHIFQYVHWKLREAE